LRGISRREKITAKAKVKVDVCHFVTMGNGKSKRLLKQKVKCKMEKHVGIDMNNFISLSLQSFFIGVNSTRSAT